MKRKLEDYGGQGYGYSPEIGKYEVKYGEHEEEEDGDVKKFTRLSVARKFYNELTVPKAIWDLTIIPELLECHTY